MLVPLLRVNRLREKKSKSLEKTGSRKKIGKSWGPWKTTFLTTRVLLCKVHY